LDDSRGERERKTRTGEREKKEEKISDRKNKAHCYLYLEHNEFRSHFEDTIMWLNRHKDFPQVRRSKFRTKLLR
jgi:hypothetical protein